MTTICHVRFDNRFKYKRHKLKTKLHRTNKGFDFPTGSLSNRDKVRSPIQFRSETQFKNLKT